MSKNCSILQVWIAQHQKDQALPYTASLTTSCPGPCHFQAGLLQCSSSRTSIKHNQTSTNDSEYSGPKRDFADPNDSVFSKPKRVHVTPLFISLHWLPVAAPGPKRDHLRTQMIQSSANPKGSMSHLSLSPCTGSRLQLTSSSRHWCLHIEQPQAQHPPTSTHWWPVLGSTSTSY